MSGERPAERIREELRRLGGRLGFEVTSEVSESFLPKAVARYKPRVDLVWSIRLEETQLRGIRRLLGAAVADFQMKPFFPLVGFEIEATDPSTKTQLSNLANLKTVAVPYGNSQAGMGLYRRAIRLVRTFNKLFGQCNYGVIDRSQISRIASLISKEQVSRKRSADRLEPSRTRGSGGEGPWSSAIRRRLDRMGRSYAFHVREDWSPSNLAEDYALRQKVRSSIERTSDNSSEWYFGRLVDWSPGKPEPVCRWNKYYTSPALDMAWTVELPSSLQKLVLALKETSNEFTYSMPILGTPFEDWPIIGFEIERGMTKHGGGGILNLSRYSYVGVLIVPTPELQRSLARIETYRVALGIQNVLALPDGRVNRALHSRQRVTTRPKA